MLTPNFANLSVFYQLSVVVFFSLFVETAPADSINVRTSYGLKSEESLRGEQFDNFAEIQRAISDAANGDFDRLYFPPGIYRVVLKKNIVDRRAGSLVLASDGVKFEFAEGAILVAEQAEETHFQPLFFVRSKTGIEFLNLQVVWKGTFLETDESGDNYFSLGETKNNRSAILFCSECESISVDGITTSGLDENQCYNHGIYTDACKNFVVNNVVASHHGSWWHTSSASTNRERGVTIQNASFCKQHLRPLNVYGPGHPVYSFSDNFTIANLVDDGSLINYGERILGIGPNGTGPFVVTQGRFSSQYRYQVYDEREQLIAAEFVMINSSRDGRTFDLENTATGLPPNRPTYIEYTPSSSGHSIKIRENNPNEETSEGILVSGVFSATPGGLITVEDKVRGDFTNMEWVAPVRFFQSSIGGNAIIHLQGSTSIRKPQYCRFSNIQLHDDYGSDLRFINLRGESTLFEEIVIDSNGSIAEILLSHAYETASGTGDSRGFVFQGSAQPILKFEKNCSTDFVCGSNAIELNSSTPPHIVFNVDLGLFSSSNRISNFNFQNQENSLRPTVSLESVSTTPFIPMFDRQEVLNQNFILGEPNFLSRFNRIHNDHVASPVISIARDISELDWDISGRVVFHEDSSPTILAQRFGDKYLFISETGKWATKLGGTEHRFNSFAPVEKGIEYKFLLSHHASSNRIRFEVFDGQNATYQILSADPSLSVGDFILGADAFGNTNRLDGEMAICGFWLSRYIELAHL